MQCADHLLNVFPHQLIPNFCTTAAGNQNSLFNGNHTDFVEPLFSVIKFEFHEIIQLHFFVEEHIALQKCLLQLNLLCDRGQICFLTHMFQILIDVVPVCIQRLQILQAVQSMGRYAWLDAESPNSVFAPTYTWLCCAALLISP